MWYKYKGLLADLLNGGNAMPGSEAVFCCVAMFVFIFKHHI
jgi:hypothetical protein